MESQLFHNGKRTSAFLHFFDVHFLELKRAHLYESEVAKEARIATRMAILCTDEILVPAASFFETPLCRKIVNDLRSLFDLGVIWLVGAAANIEEFVFNKLNQYDVKSSQYKEYSSNNLNGLPPFRTRYQSATKDIKKDWLNRLDGKRTVAEVAEGTKFVLPNNFERLWAKVPDDLDGKAFVVPYVAPLLFKSGQHPTVNNRLHYVINEAYFSSFVNEFQACTVGDLIYLASPHRVPSISFVIPFRKLLYEARKTGIFEDIVRCDAAALPSLKSDDRWVRCVVATISNREVAMKKMEEDKKEELFASPKMKGQVRTIQERSDFILDNESKERLLVGEVISTVALAGQLCREFNVSDHGIDMEIEFKNDAGEATGRRLYLQLKSGDSYLRERKHDGSEIFKIKKARHAEYWREQAFPVLLVLRSSAGGIRWMEIRDYLKRESEGGNKAVKHIVFEGEPFDVTSVLRWREKTLD